MQNCPYFECLAYSSPKCDKIVGCIGCRIHSSCEHCSRQESLIEGITVRCEYMSAAAPAVSQETQSF